MYRVLFIIALVVMVTVTLAGLAAERWGHSGVFIGGGDELADKIKKIVKTDSSGGVLVASGGAVVWEKYFNNGAETRFRVHSLTKPITAAAVVMLIKDGLLEMNTPIKKFGADFAKIPGSGQITIENLLNHTSGVYDLVSDLVYNRAPADLFARCLRGDAFVMPPSNVYLEEVAKHPRGSVEFNYNNTGYDLLGIIIERVAGVPAREFIRKRVFSPLKMADSAFHGEIPDAAPMETKTRAGIREQYGDFGANTFVVTTLQDYLKFLTGYPLLLGDHVGVYEQLYFFVDTTEYGKLMHHNGGGDFTHKFARGKGASPPLSRSYMMKFQNGYSIILCQNYGLGKRPLVDLSYNKHSKITADLAQLVSKL